MNVRASVIDIAKDTPRSTDVILVDTNVWYWFTYTRAALAMLPYQGGYQDYLKKALAVQASIRHADFSLCELAHLIEKKEAEIAGIGLKQYRAVPAKRANAVAEIETAWGQVVAISKPASRAIPSGSSADMLSVLKSAQVDGYDVAMILSAKEANAAVLTDDADYGSVSGLRVMTLNSKLVSAARKQGKLVTR